MEIAFGSVLHDDVDMAVVVEELEQFYDVRMVQFGQDGDLGTGFLWTVFLSQLFGYSHGADMDLFHGEELFRDEVLHSVADS